VSRTQIPNAIPDDVNALARIAVDAAFRVHSTLGPGLLERVYEACLVHELRKRGLVADTQVELPVVYDGVQIDAGMRIDVLVAKQLVIELKAVETILPVHKAQVLTYLKLTGHRLGLLMNFNVPLIKDGIERIAL
jgi:GxxExxY protein